MDRTSSCPAPGCGRNKGVTMYACRAHWFQLPKWIRDRVWAGYRGDAGSDWSAADRDARVFWERKLSETKEENK